MSVLNTIAEVAGYWLLAALGIGVLVIQLGELQARYQRRLDARFEASRSEHYARVDAFAHAPAEVIHFPASTGATHPRRRNAPGQADPSPRPGTSSSTPRRPR